MNNKRYDFKKWQNWHSDSGKYDRIPDYANYRIGFLPQGAPTSPKISNLVVKALDSDLQSLAESNKMVYTRYADDMHFSTATKDFGMQNARDLIKEIYRILPNYGLSPNRQKSNILSPGARKVILGTLVDSDRPRLTKEFRNKLECHLYYCSKDPVLHAEKRDFHSVIGLRNYIGGLLSYAMQIDKEYVAEIIKKTGTINWPV